jgi:hypothetical protein
VPRTRSGRSTGDSSQYSFRLLSRCAISSRLYNFSYSLKFRKKVILSGECSIFFCHRVGILCTWPAWRTPSSLSFLSPSRKHPPPLPRPRGRPRRTRRRGSWWGARRPYIKFTITPTSAQPVQVLPAKLPRAGAVHIYRDRGYGNRAGALLL